MNTGVGKLHQMLFYAGLEPEEYQACLPEIRKDNRKKLRAYLIIAGIFLLVIICLLGGLEALRANRGYYLLSFVGCLVLLAIEMMLPEDNGLLLNWLMYAFEAQLYLLGMLIMKVSPEELSVCFIAFLLAVPLLFVMPPVQHISNILFFAVIFIGLVLHVKTGRIAVIDIIDCVVFGMVSSIISSFMMVSMHQNFLSELRLRRFANFDILTNMQNRNAYESSRDSWAKKCTVSLSCVYVDVNGLHELNNASGHEKGTRCCRLWRWNCRVVSAGTTVTAPAGTNLWPLCRTSRKQRCAQRLTSWSGHWNGKAVRQPSGWSPRMQAAWIWTH